MKTILVTGGAGFIGSHLCDYLIKRGNRVFCVDAFFSGRKDNIKHLLNDKNFTLIKHNIVYPLKYKFEKLDEIYNLACPASPTQYQFDPVLTLQTSVHGVQNILDLARKYDAKVLHTSTSEVYGDPLEHPQKEDYFGNVNALGERACYDEGKRAAETLCKDYNIQYGVDVRIVRLFNVYGPKMMFNDGRVISNFILQSLCGDDITIHGDGSQSRSFMYVDDLISAFEKIMELPQQKIGIGPINIGNPDERTIKSLAEDIKRISASKSKICYVDYKNVAGRLGDPKQRCPDISKIKTIIDWSPRIDFDEGLKKTVEDFTSRLSDKGKIIIFSPAFIPFVGPAESIVCKISKRIISYNFEVITARQRGGLSKKEVIDGVTIYRVGFGNKFDKYLLPFLAPFKAYALNKKKNYQVVWGIMASYGSLAAVIFSLFSRVACMVSLYEGEINYHNGRKRRFLLPFYKMIFARAHKIQFIAKLTQQEIAWMEDENKLSPVDIDKGWDYAAQKTKEEFQELEILTSRL